MPVYRGPDGKIIEEKSKRIPSPNVRRDENTLPQSDGANKPPAPPGGGQAPGAGGSNEPTKPGRQPPSPQDGGLAPGAGRLDKPTEPMEQQRPTPTGDEQAPGAESSENPRTIIAGGREQKDQQLQEERAEKSDSMNDPVVGWLVVVMGPGKGEAMQLGYGSNAIGRGKTARVNLDFGDDQISRGGHAIVTYDPRGRKFYVQHGGGTNLTYLNDQPVLIPIELPALSHISIGSTVLRFVPLCGDAFDWQDTEENETE